MFFWWRGFYTPTIGSINEVPLVLKQDLSGLLAILWGWGLGEPQIAPMQIIGLCH